MRAGTIRNQVHLQQMEQKWQQKKNALSVNRKDVELTPEERLLQDFQRQADEIREQNSTADIYNKLKSGGMLTDEEIAYLREHDPEALAQYQEACAEKKAYKNALKHCRTKEDVEKVKLNRMGNFAAKAKSIANNPYIPKDKKVELMNRLNNEVCMIRDAHAEFVKTEEYRDMPDNEQEKFTEEKKAETVTDEAEKSDTEKSDKGITDVQETDQADAVPEKTDGTILTETVAKSNPGELSFEKMSNEIEQFVVKNSNSKPIFQANV